MSGFISRSRTDKIIGGVCGGLGRYLGVDSTIIRLIFLAFLLGGGFGFLLYLILWVIVPEEGIEQTGTKKAGEFFEERFRGVGEDIRSAASNPHPKAGLWFGAALILLGVVWFVQNLDIPWLSWVDLGSLWPVLIIVLGAAFLLRGIRGGKNND